MDLVTRLNNEFNIPKFTKEQKIWFFRTKAGLYYDDFTINGYIALGWDLIPASLIIDTTPTKERKKKEIEKIYPNEKRPGLILGQMDTFYNQMKCGDYIVIPASGSKKIAIGVIQDFTDSIERLSDVTEYEKCEFTHKRCVNWIKSVDSWQDIYLFKALKAQQTISNISNESDLVMRNLFPIYLSDDAIHLMFKKETTDDFNLVYNQMLMQGLLNVMENTADLYGMESFNDKIYMKTAVGSPGFLEIILPFLPKSLIAACILVRLIIGTECDENGKKSTGLLALLNTINRLLNDHAQRKKTNAEVSFIEANTKLTEAQIQKVQTESHYIVAQTENLKDSHLANHDEEINEQVVFVKPGLTNLDVKQQQEALCIPSVETLDDRVLQLIANGEQIQIAARKNGISIDETYLEKLKIFTQ